jgi:glycosyltransferase involved in cell wall biosynthesis
MHEVWGLPASRLVVPWARRRLGARRAAVGGADAVIAVSEAVRVLIGERAPELRIDVVPNMVDPEDNATAADRGAARTLPAGYLLAAGKLNAAKGFDGLVDTLADAGCARPLVVAGEGPLEDAMQRSARARGIELHAVGWVGGDDLLRMIRDAAAVLLPSAWEEPLSRVLLESMSVGTPVIAWRTGGSAEAIEDGRTGWLVQDRSGLERALDDLDDPARLAEVSAASLAAAASRFAPDAVYPRLSRVYESALRRSRARSGSSP